MAKTPVSILQEYCARNSVVPQYDLIVNGVGTHDPFFRYRLTVCEVVTHGDGKSKKEAKHEAARKAISELLPNNKEIKSEIVDSNNADLSSPYEGAVKENAVGELGSICANMNMPEPIYELVGEVGLPHAKTFTFECHVAKLKERASSRTKQQAKHLAAIGMINRLKLVVGPMIVERKEEEEKKLEETTEKAHNLITKLARKITGKFNEYFDSYDSINIKDFFDNSPLLKDLAAYNNSNNGHLNGIAKVNPCELLENLCESGNKSVIFTPLSSKGRYVYACHVDFTPDIVTLGVGSCDLEAKSNAAHRALLHLQSLF